MKYLHIFAAVCFLAATSASIAQVSTTVQNNTLVIKGSRPASEAASSTKSAIYIPFRVPAGTTGFTIKLGEHMNPEFRKKFMTCTAIFDPRGYGFGGAGFRGYQRSNWPTSENSEITITGSKKTTTQFYIPGIIYPGKWTIMQMLLTCPEEKFNYEYTITFHTDGPVPPYAAPKATAIDQGILDPTQGWYPGDIHFHSYRSDGAKSLEGTVATHEKDGFRFLISTDHNTCRAHYDFADTAKKHPKTLLICGEELTTFTGHANILGMKPGWWGDFRVEQNDGNLPAVIDQAHKQGALFVIDHPFTPKFPWLFPENEWSKADVLEVWNGPWSAEDQQAVEYWDTLLCKGRHITAVGGSDNHKGNSPIYPATWVYSRNLSQPAIMEALHKGHTFISEKVKGPKLILSACNGKLIPGDTAHIGKKQTLPVQVSVSGAKGMKLRIISSQAEKMILIRSNDAKINRTLKIKLNNKHGYIRAELIKPDGKIAALTNAIYIEK